MYEFPTGLMVYFTTTTTEGTRENTIHKPPCDVDIVSGVYIVRGLADRELFGVYSVCNVIAILPLQTVGPAAS